MSLTPSPCFIKCSPYSEGKWNGVEIQTYIISYFTWFHIMLRKPAFISRIKRRLKRKYYLWGERRGRGLCLRIGCIYCEFKYNEFSQYSMWSSIPYPAWWHETPPLGYRSLSPYRPNTRSPSYHSSMWTPTERDQIDWLLWRGFLMKSVDCSIHNQYSTSTIRSF